MSIFGDIFGTGPQTNTRTETPSVPGNVQGAVGDLLGRAQSFAAQPYTPYTQPRVAGFTPDQLAGFEAARDIAGTSGALSQLTPELTREGIEATRGLAVALPDVDISEYMSPYTEAALDPAIRDMQERADAERQRLGQRSALTGSFGGSRQAIAESELERGVQRNIGDLSARERANAYNNALAQFRLDQTAIPGLYSSALNQLGTGLTQNAARLGSESNPLLAIGGAQQALDQRNLDALRESFVEERDYPLRGMEALRGALGINTSAMGIGATRADTQPGPNVLGSITGAITQVPKFLEGANALGGVLGGLGTAVRGFFS